MAHSPVFNHSTAWFDDLFMNTAVVLTMTAGLHAGCPVICIYMIMVCYYATLVQIIFVVGLAT